MPPKGDLQLSIGYWIVSHRQTLRTWWAISSMLIIAGTLLWMILYFVLAFSQEGRVNNLIISGTGATSGFTVTSFQPQPLSSGVITVISRDDTHVDVVTELTNPNNQWAAQAVTVHFTVDSVAQQPLHLFVNQNEHRPVIQFNVPVTKATAVNATITVDDTDWTRSSVSSLPAAVFSVTNVLINPSTITVQGQSRTSVSVTAQVTNESVYNFYHVDVPMVLTSSDRIVGVGLVGIDRWPTLSTRPVTLTWAYPVGQVTDVRIAPQVNRFDVSNTYR